jgi:hypothetical protein
MYEKVYQCVKKELLLFIIPDITNIILKYIDNIKDKWIIKYKQYVLDEFKFICKISLIMQNRLSDDINPKYILEKVNYRKQYKIFYNDPRPTNAIYYYMYLNNMNR